MNAVADFPAVHSFEPPAAPALRPSLANASLRPTDPPRGGEPRRIGEILPDVLARYGLRSAVQALAAEAPAERRRAARQTWQS